MRVFKHTTIKKLLLSSVQVAKLLIGKDGILSTPAVSRLIRSRRTNGGIILTASHNPGGPKNDFGIKFNCDNGGPAPDAVTERIYELSTKIAEYRLCPELNVDFGQLGSTTVAIEGVGQFTVEVIDSVVDYVNYMEEIFDFGKVTRMPFVRHNKQPECSDPRADQRRTDGQEVQHPGGQHVRRHWSLRFHYSRRQAWR